MPLVAGGLQPIIFPCLLRLFQPIILSLSPKASPSHNTARRLTCGPNPSPFHTSRLCQRRRSPCLSLPPPSPALSLPGCLPPSGPGPLSRPHPVPAWALTSPPASSFALSPWLGSSSHAPSPLPFSHFPTHSSVCGVDSKAGGERVPPEGDRPVTAPASLTKHHGSWPSLPRSPIPGPGSDCRQNPVWVRIHLEPLLSSRNTPAEHHKQTLPTASSPHTLVGKRDPPYGVSLRCLSKVTSLTLTTAQ